MLELNSTMFWVHRGWSQLGQQRVCGWAGPLHPEVDGLHSLRFSNKACFHGDRASPIVLLFYGSGAHECTSVTPPPP